MAKLMGVELKSVQFELSEEAQSRLVLLQGVRLVFFYVILLILVTFQIRQPDFVSFQIVYPLYSLLAGVFFLNIWYTMSLHRFVRKLSFVTAVLFAIDALFITGLIYYTEFNQSIFLFMYLVNIILCGLVFQRYGALILALLTSMCFSFLLVVGPALYGATLYFTVGINNLAFFSVAILSGYLSEQLNFMGSEIKARDADIRILQNLNKIIVENISTGLMTIHRTGKVLHHNPAAKRILDFDRSLDSIDIHQIFPDLLTRLQLNSTEKSGRFELIYMSPRGERLLLGCSVSTFKDSVESDEGGYILIFQDLTEIKRLERAMQRSEKLAAVGKLAAGIAHEIRNPLASISGSIQMLKASVASTQSEDQRLMAIALKEIDRLNLLISEFLDFVRPEQMLEKVVDLNLLIKETMEMARVNTKLRKDVEQVFQFNTERKIIGNPDKLKQAFLNFVINAYQAMEKSPVARLTVQTELHRGVVRVHLRDTGVGMPETVQRRLFEPFFTTKHGGTGLGLATTHKILESHEARIHVDSHEGTGTEFTIDFTKLAPIEQPTDNNSETKRGHG